MKSKTLIGFVAIILVALLAVSFAMASTADSSSISGVEVSVNDVELESGVTQLSAMPGETVPVTVRFTADADLRDLKVQVEAEGYKEDVDASTARFDVVNGSTYIKKLSLTLPTVEDMESDPEGFDLHVSIANRNTEEEVDYVISLERDSYDVKFLQVDAPSTASAGEIIAIDVVIKNIGGRDAEDTFVTASIPELNLYKRVYFGDIFADDNYDDNADRDTDNEDARQGRLYLVIPSDVKTGEYGLEVKASNYDSVETSKKVIGITGKAVVNATNATAVQPANGNSKVPTSVIVLTVVLAIIFVVLLVVLIVLLTKKPSEKIEDFGETSYY